MRCENEGCEKWPTPGEKFCKQHGLEVKLERKASLQAAILIEKSEDPKPPKRLVDEAKGISPSWSTSSWLMSLQLVNIPAKELTKDMRPEDAEAGHIKAMTKEQIQDAVANATISLQD